MFILIYALVIIILLNIPFGYWRANVRKFSWQWFMAIHSPIPCVAFLRKHVLLGDSGMALVLFLAAYFVGQYLGSTLSKELGRQGKVSSFLFFDLIRRTWVIIIGR